MVIFILTMGIVISLPLVFIIQIFIDFIAVSSYEAGFLSVCTADILIG